MPDLPPEIIVKKLEIATDSYDENDDGGGSYGLNSHLALYLTPGTYTVAATTWGRSDVGSYTLDISGYR